MKSRGIIIAGNWKMNHLPAETKAFIDRFKKLSTDQKQIQDAGSRLKSLLFPPMLSLPDASDNARGSTLQIGAQNAWGEASGAFTGEISATMLRDIQIQWVLVGHSERRHVFGESNALILKRVQGLLGQGMKVMLCIGETEPERKAGKTEAVIDRQLSESLASPWADSALKNGQLSLAYEPVWAIGTGLTATPAQAEEAQKYCRKWIWDHYGMDCASQVSILYGGSVKPDNLAELLSCPNIDGALIGGASLKVDDFFKMVLIGSEALN